MKSEDVSNTSTVVEGLSTTTPSTQQAKGAFVDQFENDMDLDFFNKNKAQKIKLNKGEKRALKFAMKAGEEIGQEVDLKAFLAERIKQSK